MRLIQNLEEIKTAQLWCLALPERLLEAFAEYLSQVCQLPVKMLDSGESLKEGFIYLTGVEHWWKFSENEDGSLRVERTGTPSGVTREELFDVLLLEASALLGPKVLAVVGSGRFEKGKVGLEELRKLGGEVLVVHRKHCLYPEASIYFAEGGRYPEFSLEVVGRVLSFWPEREVADVAGIEGYAGGA